MADPLGSAGVRELALGLRAGRWDEVDLAAECARRIAAGGALNAFLWHDGAALMDGARAARRRRAGGFPGGPLQGIPLAVKDNIDTAGVPTTSGSPVDRERIPQADAPVWRRLRDEAGAQLAGKAHMSEFALLAPHPDFGPVRNPLDHQRTPGSSSSGSAAAVAGDLVPAALGTDTGGSVRMPASFCGIVGLKPTYDLIERHGIVPLSWSQDHVGVLAKTVTDAAIVLEAMAPVPLGLVDPGRLEVVARQPSSVRIGVAQAMVEGASDDVAALFEKACRSLEQAGCTLVPVRLPDAGASQLAQRTILVAEAYTYHRRRLASGAPYGEAFREAVEAGADIPAAAYLDAARMRTVVVRKTLALLETVDVIAYPTALTVAPRLEDVRRSAAGSRHVRNTCFANFCGCPALSVPCGRGEGGMPVGFHLMARPYGEGVLVGVALLAERLLEGG